jgi:predicted ATPase
MREGLATLVRWVPRSTSQHARAAGRRPCGEIEAGSALEEALVTAEQHAERFYEAELHRLKGELFLRQWREAGTNPSSRALQLRQAASGETAGGTPLQREAEACFQSALALARRQRAKMLELRAALSLSRLWQQQGKQATARQLMAEVYGWFTEGFETTDLQEAGAFLQELGG